MDSLRKAQVDQHISVPKASRELGKAQATILSLIVAGELDGQRVAGRIVITRESVDAYRARNAPTVAPVAD